MAIKSTLDQRFTYGAACTWAGSIDEAGNTSTHPAHQRVDELNGTRRYALPCCPLCGGVLFQVNDKAAWDEMISRYDATHPGYAAMWAWQKAENRCFKSITNMAEAYRLATGNVVTL